MELPVRGHVKLGQGGATISLSPLIQPPGPKATTPTPSLDTVATWQIHPSRQPLSRDAFTQAIILVQKQLSLPDRPAFDGSWSDQATDRLKGNLRKAKRGAASEDKPAEETTCLQRG